MRPILLNAGLVMLLAVPVCVAAQVAPQAPSESTYDHGEISAYGDMFRVAPKGASASNFLGFGARVGFNTGRYVALEGEMSYDFEKNYTNISVNGSGNGGNGSGTGSVSTTTYTAKVRPISGLFGPKFQFGASSAFRAFIDAKVGFMDFSTSCNAPAGSGSCFANSLSGFGGSSTHFALYPGGGIEGFMGPIGLRVDAGDDMYWNGGRHDNLRIAFGPAIRF